MVELFEKLFLKKKDDRAYRNKLELADLYLDQHKRIGNREEELERRNKELTIRESLLSLVEEKAKAIGDQANWKADLREEYNSNKLDLVRDLTSLEADVKNKKELLALSEASNAKELEVRKATYELMIAEKDKTIDLLRDQLKILTAKLTEINISDVHLHTKATVQTSKE